MGAFKEPRVGNLRFIPPCPASQRGADEAEQVAEGCPEGVAGAGVGSWHLPPRVHWLIESCSVSKRRVYDQPYCLAKKRRQE